MEYVVIHGQASYTLQGKGDSELRDYIAKLVYGTPERIFGTLLDSGKFVALVEYDGSGDSPWAPSTFARMGSFSYGSQYLLDTGKAFQEFGSWVAHYSGWLGLGAANMQAERVSGGGRP